MPITTTRTIWDDLSTTVTETPAPLHSDSQKKFVELLEKADTGCAVTFFKNCHTPIKALNLIERKFDLKIFWPEYSFGWDESPEGFIYWEKIRFDVCKELGYAY